MEEARKQLSFRYIHIRKSGTGVLDYFLDCYAARNASSPISIEDWIRTEYKPKILSKEYAAKKTKERFWQGWRLSPLP